MLDALTTTLSPVTRPHYEVYGSASLRHMLTIAECRLIAERRWTERNPMLAVTHGGSHREALRQVRVLTEQLALRFQVEAGTLHVRG